MDGTRVERTFGTTLEPGSERLSAALITAHVLAILVGITIGLFGGGGAILMVPILSYIAGWPTQDSITGSLFIVGITSLFSTFLHARPTKEQRERGHKKGNVRWGTGVVFGGLAMLGAFAGGQLTALLPGIVVMTIFAIVMIASGIGMVRGRKPSAPAAPRATDGKATPSSVGTAATLPLTRAQKVKIVLAALGIGVISGLVGAGGGFLVVPALALLVGFTMPAAVGTSLLVVSMQSASGFLSHILHVDVDWQALGSLTGLAMAGTILGTLLGSHIPAAKLKRAFGVFVLLMAAVVLAQEYLLA